MGKIIVDNRESKDIIRELTKEGLEIELKQLTSADFILQTKNLDNKIQNVGIERKTIQDLLNSIIDKRLINQLILLKKSFDLPLLIIEGEENIYEIRDFHPNSIRGIISMVALDFQIPIIYTRNFRDTAALINTIAKRLEKSRKPLTLLAKRKPLTTKEAAELIAEFKKYVPEYCRIMRVQRDIPTYVTSSGVDRTNLRQYVGQLCKEKGIKCRCIRCREAGLNTRKISLNNIKIKTTEYKSSKGKEFFISAEDEKNDILFGYCKLRFPSQSLRKEITKESALVRELHIYSPSVALGEKSESSYQHRGFGKMLLKKAEETAKQNKRKKILVLSGIGAKEYYSKLGYKKEGHYMSKMLD